MKQQNKGLLQDYTSQLYVLVLMYRIISKRLSMVRRVHKQFFVGVSKGKVPFARLLGE